MADAEGARLQLERRKKRFERIAPRLTGHYVSERGILYNVGELDEWLMGRQVNASAPISLACTRLVGVNVLVTKNIQTYSGGDVLVASPSEIQ